MRTTLSTFLAATLVAGLCACSAEPAAETGEAGAKKVLTAMLSPTADHAALTTALKPKTEDYVAAFEGDAAKKAEAAYDPMWRAGKVVVKPKEGQTELLLYEATTEDLRAGTGHAKQFPGGYSQVAKSFKPGQKWYRFKFTKPGDKRGMAYDGLTYVNGRWVIFPKPYRALRE